MNVDFDSINKIMTVAIAFVALVISAFSFKYSRRAVMLAERQEEGAAPQLVPALLNGYKKIDNETGDRIYAFFLSISNRSDSGNSIVNLKLNISYITSKEILMTVKLGSNDQLNSAFNFSTEKLLIIPQTINAHATITGWCFFITQHDLFHGAKIEDHILEIRDNFEIRSSVNPGYIQEYREENNG